MLPSGVTGSTATGTTGGTTGAAATKDVEVFTWWAAGGEKAGRDGMQSVFRKDCSQDHFVNAAVGGGGGEKAKTLLATNPKGRQHPRPLQATVRKH